jgi:prepilin-type N-terminal cleavage/methylation domain-containing protein
MSRQFPIVPCPARLARSKRVRGAAGFTLIEVVLAVTIFALMGGVLYGAFSLGHTAVEKSEKSFNRSQKIRSTGDLLATYIRSGYPYRESIQEQTIFFEGERESLTFVSAYSHGMGGRGMAIITIEKQDTETGRMSFRLTETAPVRVGSEGGDAGQRYSLLIQEGIRDFHLAYLDVEGDKENWEDRWDGKERPRLPRALKISFIDAEGKAVRWVFPFMLAVLSQ